MAPARLVLATLLVLLAFAGNSLLCRAALAGGHADAASFTALRLAAGALVLWCVWRPGRGRAWPPGDAVGAIALFAYAIAFSLAYVSLGAATGALVLFAAVQASVLAGSHLSGTRWTRRELGGLVLAFAGLAYLLWPGLAAPPAAAAATMVVAGLAWGVYTLRGRGGGDPLGSTAGNFLRALPLAGLALGLAALSAPLALDGRGILLALASGALTSGLGYVLWYAVLPRLSAPVAGSVQLAVPPLAALLAVAGLGETIGPRWLPASVAILGGIAFTLPRRAPR